MQFSYLSIIIIVITFFGCKKEVNPNPDLAGLLAGTYQVKQVVSILNTKVDTTRVPYLYGKIIIERSNAYPTQIGISGGITFTGDGNPVDETQYNEQRKLFPVPNPQNYMFAVSQRNDTIYFTDNQKIFGKFIDNTLIERVIYSPTWESTITAAKL
jgi:hypothetical protein